MNKPLPQTRADYVHLSTITTRWMDNDVYGHVNNVTYYSYFDTAVNKYLIDRGVLDIHHGAVIGLVIETHCNFMASLAFPRDVTAGIRVAHIGRSSVRYEIGLFDEGANDAAATGHFVHVYVDAKTRRPVPLPDDLLAVLQGLHRPAPQQP